MNFLRRGLALTTLAGLMAGHGLVVAADLQAADAVLARTAKRPAVATTTVSQASQLLRDMAEFRRTSAQLSPDKAATAWLALWDRVGAIDPVQAAADPEAFDTETKVPVGLRSAIAVLPSPSAWPLIRQQATARALSKPDDVSALGLRLITEVLAGDTAAAGRSLAEFERLAVVGDPGERETKRATVNRTRALVYKLYGSREEIAAGFLANVEAQLRQSYGRVDVPDLVGLLGPAQAEKLLTDLLKKPVSFQIAQGEATRVMARKLALDHIDSLGKAQWALVDAVGTSALYEAMRKRFDPVADSKKDAAEEADGEIDYLRQYADVYYFLDLVIAGRRDEAERAMLRVTSNGGSLNISKQAMSDLIRAGQSEAVYRYLAQLLERRPDMAAWDVYLEQAGYLGHAQEALALLDRLLKRRDLSGFVRADLAAKRLDALLGADQVDKAAAGFKELLMAAPMRDEAKLDERVTAAIRLAGLGRVLKQQPLSDVGFAFAGKAVALPVTASRNWRPAAVRDLSAELRRQGRVAEAQQLALAELEREDPRYAGFSTIIADPAKRAALVELAGLYDAAGRSADVLRLLNEVGIWGARDLREAIADKDSLGTPLGMMAARALKANGRATAARASVLALLDRLPGHDPAYQLLVDLGTDEAVAELDRRYARDQFEERPLIWKAFVLNMGRQYDAAEGTVRRAIAIDPSDGEQGPNDRMRAYAVLADVMQARGQPKASQDYRQAVSAIRLAEQADELRKLGLYQRASALYKSALGEFSDAYCIQSRLAVQLGKMGLRDEALVHYRRAFELMPDSFGRVESHCFGCESVFAGPRAQEIAEQVFTALIQRGSNKPQAPYMLGYLRMEQGRYDEALVLFRQAVALDSAYLNAWKHLQELGDKTYIEASERDIARLKLYEFDPRQLHVRYQLNEVADLGALWRALSRAPAAPAREPVYPLASSAKERSEALAAMPPDMRQRLEGYALLQEKMEGPSAAAQPSLADHRLFLAALQLMGDRGGRDVND